MGSCDGNFVFKIYHFFFLFFIRVFLFDLFQIEICLLFGRSHISGLISVVIISLLVHKWQLFP